MSNKTQIHDLCMQALKVDQFNNKTQKHEQEKIEEQLDWIEIYGLDTEQFRPSVTKNYYYDGKEGRIKNS